MIVNAKEMKIVQNEMEKNEKKAWRLGGIKWGERTYRSYKCESVNSSGVQCQLIKGHELPHYAQTVTEWSYPTKKKKCFKGTDKKTSVWEK